MANTNEKIFDEKNPIWINAYKTISVIIFFILIALSLVFGILGLTCIVSITNYPFLDGIILLGLGLIASFAELIVSMVIVQLLTNVQIIREKLEK